MKLRKATILLIVFLCTFIMLSGCGKKATNEEYEYLEVIPKSQVTTKATAAGVTAQANWFVKYGTSNLEIVAYVEDSAIYVNEDMGHSDNVEVIITKTQRLRGYSEKTISIFVDARGKILIKNTSTNVVIENTGTTASVKNFSLNRKTIDGYYVTICVPYTAIESSAKSKDTAICFGLTNANNAISLKHIYDNSYGLNYRNAHTYIAVTADNTFEANPYIDYSMVWGDGGKLPASSAWEVDYDDGTEDAYIALTTVDDADNRIYMRNSNVLSYYAELKITAKELQKGERFAKFGLSVANANLDGLFFYVEAGGDGSTIASNSIGIGRNTRSNGKWDNGWYTYPNVKIGETSAVYQNDSYITLGIKRQGKNFTLYANGAVIDTYICVIGEDEEAWLGITAFSVSLSVKDYSIEIY